MKVVARVFHNKGADECFRFESSSSALVYQHDVTVEDGEVDEVLERVFRAANRVDGSEVEQVPDFARSLSMGDVVSVDGAYYACAMFGWKKIRMDEFSEAISRGHRLGASQQGVK